MKCLTKHCRKNKKQGNYCYSCVMRKYAAKNPVKYAYIVLRQNAKRRGHEFTITFSEFEEFCTKTSILLGRGRTKDSYSIDRIRENEGYVPGNLQVLTVSENTKKYSKWVKYDYQTKYGTTVKVFDEQNTAPF